MLKALASLVVEKAKALVSAVSEAIVAAVRKVLGG